MGRSCWSEFWRVEHRDQMQRRTISADFLMCAYNIISNPAADKPNQMFYRQGITSNILLSAPVHPNILSSNKSNQLQLVKTGPEPQQLPNSGEPENLPQNTSKQAPRDQRRPGKCKKVPKTTKSFNHNFQKHTVVTIKKLGHKMCQTFGNSSVEAVAAHMWKIFNSSSISSKKILVALFGEANLKLDKTKDLFRSCYLAEIYQQDEETVRKAQTLLRIRLLELTDHESVRAHIFRSRKISQREEFIAYFDEFINMLRAGPLRKFRLNAESAHHIQQIIRESQLAKTLVKTQQEVEYRQQ